MIQIERSGKLVWGSATVCFPVEGNMINLLFDHDGGDSIADWNSDFLELQANWHSLRVELEVRLPGGLGAAKLQRADFRSHLRPSRVVLHFATTADHYDWFVRLGPDWKIEIAAQKD